LSDPDPPAPTQASGRLLGRLWRDYLHVHRWRIAAAFLFMVIEGSTLALLAWMLGPLFDRVFVGREEGAIWWVGGIIFLLFLTRAATLVINRSLVTRVSLLSSAAMQSDLLQHILRLEGGFYQTTPPGALIERVQGDTAAVQGVWSTLILGLGRDIFALVSLMGVALSIDLEWTLVALMGAPLLILPALAIQRYIRRKTEIVRNAAGERVTRLDEVFHGIAAVKLNGMEAYQLGRYRAIVARIVGIETKTAAIRAAMPALIDIVTGLGFFGVLLLGGKDVIAGDRTVGEFMSFFTAMSLAFQPLRRLGDLAGTWQTAAVSLRRVYALLDRVPAADLRGGTRRPDPAQTDIAFSDVHLSYAGVPVLNGISFSLPGGQLTAIVGPSGAGKTSVFNLLTRMVDPDSGAIRIGGIDTSDMDLAALRGLFSVVAQDAALFDETIRDNILAGRDGVSDAALDRAAEAAHVTDFTAALPAGLGTRAGPRGSALSGGQRQRVAIARAVLRNAPILLLDEATSALDAASEALVQDAIERVAHGRTTLVIAHRLATVRNADHILVMDRGRIVEQGRHDTLFAAGGLYASLCRLQFTEPEGRP
jgi:ATP-binding cassette subfamily B protein/subfamily B ATP-binding cassette protein MsbA